MADTGNPGVPSGRHDLVVIGTSLGGVQALQQLAADLPESFPAPVLVVLHVGAHYSVMPRLLASKGPLPALHPRDGETMRPGHLYVAPPDRHMLVDGPLIRLAKGPKENHARPAIDPLFRSAALSRGPDVIGVVLTGLLDDGTAGLQAVKACGGRAIVQDPADALAPDMPASALAWVDVDHCVPLARLPALLGELTARGPVAAASAASMRERVANEHEWFLGRGDIMEHMQTSAAPSTFVCPECKGTLWELADDGVTRYRCHTGHAFTMRSLEHMQCEQTDEALWGAVRALQEREALLERLRCELESRGDAEGAADAAEELAQASAQAEALRSFVRGKLVL